MTQHDALTLGDVDADSALQETAERAGVTRGEALRRAVLGGGALVGGWRSWGRDARNRVWRLDAISASTRAS